MDKVNDIQKDIEMTVMTDERWFYCSVFLLLIMAVTQVTKAMETRKQQKLKKLKKLTKTFNNEEVK